MPSREDLIKLRQRAIAKLKMVNDKSGDDDWLSTQQAYIVKQIKLVSASVNNENCVSCNYDRKTTPIRRCRLLEKWLSELNFSYQYNNDCILEVCLDFLPNYNPLKNAQAPSDIEHRQIMCKRVMTRRPWQQGGTDTDSDPISECSSDADSNPISLFSPISHSEPEDNSDIDFE